MRLVFFLALLIAIIIAPFGPAQADSSLTLKVMNEVGLGLSSTAFPYLFAELYRYEDSGAAARINSTDCWSENRRLCAEDGVLVFNKDYLGNPIGAGSYLVWLSAGNYEGDWYRFDLDEGDVGKDAVALKPKPVSIFFSQMSFSEGRLDVAVGLYSSAFKTSLVEVCLIAQGPGLTERWMERQLANCGKGRALRVGRKASFYFDYLKANPNLEDGLVYCVTVYAMRAGTGAFGEALGVASECRPKGASSGDGKG